MADADDLDALVTELNAVAPQPRSTSRDKRAQSPIGEETQTARLRVEHEERYAGILAELESVGLRPVELGSADSLAVDEAFGEWAEERRRGRWAR